MKRTPLITILLTLFVLVGCDRITRDKYEMITTGMTMDEVVEILGEPTEMTSVGIGPLEASTARWEGRTGTISIQFTGEKVRLKRFLANERAEDDGHDS